jgi:hypothetical protein
MSADRINPAGNRRTVTYKGVAMAVADVPNPYLRAMLGYGHYPDHNRPVLAGGWPWTPATCPTDDYPESVGIWLDEEHLACRGCGLDIT